VFACGQTGGGIIKKFIRINEKIRVPEVRLIGAEGNQLGIVSTDKAREIAVQSELDLVEVALQAIEAVRAEAEARKITLGLKAPATLRMERADRCEMDMVFNNLLTNAVKYNRDGGRVGVAIEPQGGAMAISVTDTGIGMTPEETSLLFQEFVRIKNEKTRNVLGSGLGLSILKRIVALYDGTIDVKSQPDAGTTFAIKLKTPVSGTEEL
jgi:two-component system sensor histidine kinase/response regulator